MPNEVRSARRLSGAGARRQARRSRTPTVTLALALVGSCLWWAAGWLPGEHGADPERLPRRDGGTEPAPPDATDAPPASDRDAVKGPDQPSSTSRRRRSGARADPSELTSSPPRGPTATRRREPTSAPHVEAPSWDPDLPSGKCALYFRGRSRAGSSATWWCRARRPPGTIDEAVAEAFRRGFRSDLTPGRLRPATRPDSGDLTLKVPGHGARVTWGHLSGGRVRFTIYQPGRTSAAAFLEAAGFDPNP